MSRVRFTFDFFSLFVKTKHMLRSTDIRFLGWLFVFKLKKRTTEMRWDRQAQATSSKKRVKHSRRKDQFQSEYLDWFGQTCTVYTYSYLFTLYCFVEDIDADMPCHLDTFFHAHFFLDFEIEFFVKMWKPRVLFCTNHVSFGCCHNCAGVFFVVVVSKWQH